MGIFIVKKSNKNEVNFNLKAANGAIVATSQIFKSKNDCTKEIEKIRENSVAAVLEDQTIRGFQTQKNPKFEIFKDKSGEFRFRLKDEKGDIILKSEGYTVKASCKNGIASVCKNAPDAKILEDE